jgi:hypothetical protein
MDSTDRILLRLHVEAVWDVRLPSLMLNDVELLPDGEEASWDLCAADLASDRVYIWRPDVTSMEQEVLRLRASEALTFPPPSVRLPGVHREEALSLVASPRLEEATAQSIARPLLNRIEHWLRRSNLMLRTTTFVRSTLTQRMVNTSWHALLAVPASCPDQSP